MGNIIKIPTINPVQFYWVERPIILGKNQLFMWDDWLKNQIPEWYARTNYSAKWQRSDNIYLQISSNFSPITYKVITCKQEVLMEGSFNYVNGTPSGKIYEFYDATIQLADPVFNGVSQVYIIISGMDGETPITNFISEPLTIGDSFPETILFKYKFDKGHYHEVWFTGSNIFSFRIEGRIKNYQPGSIAKTYIDQQVNTVQLSRYASDQYTLSIGHSYGVPDYMIKKVNNIFDCSYVEIEATQFTLADDATWEATRIDYYSLAGWTTTIVPTRNLYYDYSDTSLDDQISIAYNIDGKVMGIFNGQAATTDTLIIDSE